MNEIQDLGTDLRKYRTEIPNMVLEMGLTVYEIALYVHLKRTAGDNGISWKSTQTLVKETSMGAGSIVRAKKGLVNYGLIEISQKAHKSGTDNITIVPLWEKNFQHFINQRSPHEQGVPCGNGGVPHMNDSVPQGKQRINQLRKNQEEPFNGRLSVFSEISGIKQTKAKKKVWAKIDQEWEEMGVTEKDVPKMYIYAIENFNGVAGPKSITSAYYMMKTAKKPRLKGEKKMRIAD